MVSSVAANGRFRRGRRRARSAKGGTVRRMAVDPTTAPKAPSPAYTSYDGFLKTAIETYWSTRRNQIHFVALLLASREAWEVAWDGIRAPGTGTKVLTGAAGVTAVVIALRLLIGGPIGLVLTGVSIAGLAAVYVRNHRRIWDQQE